MQKLLDSFKNSRFIHAICDQINRLPSPIVGLLMIVAIFVGIFVFGALGFTTFAVLATALMLALTTIPYGLGFGVIGLGVHVLFWMQVNETSINKHTYTYITKQSIKLWGLAGILGFAAFALFPMGRQLLSNTQSIAYNESIDDKMLVGFGIFAAGWIIIATTQIPKLFTLLPKIYAGMKKSVELTGMSSIQKCSELNNQ